MVLQLKDHLPIGDVMLNTLFGALGQGFNQGHMAQQNAAQASQYGLAQNQQAYAQQQAMGAQQAMSSGQANYGNANLPKWMIDGKIMNFKEFMDTIFPDDTPEKTMFLLKYTKE